MNNLKIKEKVILQTYNDMSKKYALKTDISPKSISKIIVFSL